MKAGIYLENIKNKSVYMLITLGVASRNQKPGRHTGTESSPLILESPFSYMDMGL